MPQISSVVIHCRDQYVMAPFWSLVTGLPIADDDQQKLADRTLEPMEPCLLNDPAGDVDVWVAVAEELRPPGRVHLDIIATHDEQEEIIAAGATLVRRHADLTVLTDPEGNQFCLIRERH
jgi:hypothetical protein